MPRFSFSLNRAGFLRRSRLLVLAFALGTSLALVACQRLKPLDTSVLDQSGMSFATVQALRDMDITNAEVDQIAKARQAGLSDDDCLTLFRLERSRKQDFDIGDAVAQLLGAGVSGSTVIQLEQIDQLRSWGGEATAMRLAGLSDEIILEDAHRRASDLPVLSGASLANLKNTGMREATLLQLVRRGVPDDETSNIISLRRRGWSDAMVLRRYPGGR
jgi:uncharacterized protein (DUF433 family)